MVEALGILPDDMYSKRNEEVRLTFDLAFLLLKELRTHHQDQYFGLKRAEFSYLNCLIIFWY